MGHHGLRPGLRRPAAARHRLADRLGHRRAFRIGLIGFAAASALGGAAAAPVTLFATLLAPSALALLSITFTETRQRGTAFGVYGALSSSGAAIGLLAGGALTEYADWRWCMYLNVPIAALALLVIWRSVLASVT